MVVHFVVRMEQDAAKVRLVSALVQSLLEQLDTCSRRDRHKMLDGVI
ncbi:hypothetical protein LSH36_1371g00030 [Paralvinella palmiformis]|uniref:Uncharacterized protein n=1 Tax=Paralvinella palmiformis TaxID=53620 RepID=A0AAD9ITR8_9ANNE|nr:hypothetical protein LSH36_1371g00030 [Paralvinella palmiformis]